MRVRKEPTVLNTMTITTTKCQQILRNGKQFWFFPDVTVDDLTKGFLVDADSPIVGEIQALWLEYCDTEKLSYFSVFLNMRLEDTRTREHVYLMYKSLLSSQVEVIGMAVPKQSVVVKKRKLASL